ncbi:MAG: YigZ family protein [Balneolaceae bacterium]|nr:YigZ family protein [Balneolaceae bacterium]
MKTIKEPVSATLTEKGSRFTGFLFHIETRERFDEKFDQLVSQHEDASHHCCAWRIGLDRIDEYANDAGEPSGTAGMPILNQLRSHDVSNTGLVVVRYFGGTKLGRSGLIKAYGRTAGLCLEKSRLVTIVPTRILEIVYAYDQENRVKQLENRFGLKELETSYRQRVRKKFACPQVHAAECIEMLENLEHTGINLEVMGEGYLTQ